MTAKRRPEYYVFESLAGEDKSLLREPGFIRQIGPVIARRNRPGPPEEKRLRHDGLGPLKDNRVDS